MCNIDKKVTRRGALMSIGTLALLPLAATTNAAVHCSGSYYIHYDAWGRPYHQHYTRDYYGNVVYTYWHY